MTKYLLVNRRAGKFTEESKRASRAALDRVLAIAPPGAVVEDHKPEDQTARRVIVLELDEAAVAKLAGQIPEEVVLEPLVRRELRQGPSAAPRELMPHKVTNIADATKFRVSIKGGGVPLAGALALFYVDDQWGNFSCSDPQVTRANGEASIRLSPGQSVVFVEAIPYSNFWSMLVEAPVSGTMIDCIPLPKAPTDGKGWWHMATNTGAAKDGAGIRVGVIDTGCGPHPNLKHVKLVAAFCGGKGMVSARDVADHGTHTTGIIGARPSHSGDYSGLAPACDLFHVRVFASENQAPDQADIIRAIDILSREHKCDLINMSFGGEPPSDGELDCIRDALERGTLCICATGNDAGPINFPAAYAECVSVSAIGQIGWPPLGTSSAERRPLTSDLIFQKLLGRDKLFFGTFSSRGLGLDVVGPGVGIVSTVPDRGRKKGLYAEKCGTSSASPAVCGALAAILSRDPYYASLPRDGSRSHAARQLLEANCISVGLAKTLQGFGLPVAGTYVARVYDDAAAQRKRRRKPRN